MCSVNHVTYEPIGKSAKLCSCALGGVGLRAGGDDACGGVGEGGHVGSWGVGFGVDAWCGMVECEGGGIDGARGEDDWFGAAAANTCCRSFARGDAQARETGESRLCAMLDEGWDERHGESRLWGVTAGELMCLSLARLRAMRACARARMVSTMASVVHVWGDLVGEPMPMLHPLARSRDSKLTMSCVAVKAANIWW